MLRLGLTVGPSTTTARSRRSLPCRMRSSARSWRSSPRMSGRQRPNGRRPSPPTAGKLMTTTCRGLTPSPPLQPRCEQRISTKRGAQQSLAIDANYARSYVLLANTYDVAWVNHLDSDYLNPAALDIAHQFARRAVELDPNLPEARSMLGLTLMWMRQHDASLAEFERAIALNPNYVDWRFGLVFIAAGKS